jgi:hypothetical protein
MTIAAAERKTATGGKRDSECHGVTHLPGDVFPDLRMPPGLFSWCLISAWQ